MKLKNNIHHRRSIRLKGYDYSSSGAYFVTICVHNRQLMFGEISDGKIMLNEYGRIARQEWIRTPEIRGYVELDEFVIMPNHMHGIIILDDCRGTVHRASTYYCHNLGMIPRNRFLIIFIIPTRKINFL